uniref:Reverse transcriptase n=1 Tax=Chroomonas mesostigmatica CCMP1168 TaxID=1195612 RepID=A0A248SPS5_9CRYP|nr:reverse transcriptase [Chroomonas mesostigmatica CCMP1168]
MKGFQERWFKYRRNYHLIMNILERIESLRTRNQNTIRAINKELYKLVNDKDLVKRTSMKTAVNLNKLQRTSSDDILKTSAKHQSSDKKETVQKALVLILEAIYEPSSSGYNNNFGTKIGCITRVKKIKSQWKNVDWVIKGNFNETDLILNQYKLLQILRKKIQDEKFLGLIWAFLQNSLGFTKPVHVTSRPNELTTLLANIYINEFDVTLEELRFKINRVIIEKNYRKAIPNNHVLERGNYKFDLLKDKVNFVRTGQTWMIGVSKAQKVSIKVKRLLQLFLTKKLCLPKEPIKIIYLQKTNIVFLGYMLLKKKQYLKDEVMTEENRTTRLQWSFPTAEVIKELANKSFCTKLGKGIAKLDWVPYTEKTIITNYETLLTRLKSRYFLADNYKTSIRRLEYIIKFSCAHTLASKHRSTVSTQIKRLDHLRWYRTSSKLTRKVHFRNDIKSVKAILAPFREKENLILITPCGICNMNTNIESHSMKTIDKKKTCMASIVKDELVQNLDRKQFCICKSCQSESHKLLRVS